MFRRFYVQNHGEGRISIREKRMAILSTVASIVLGGLLGTVSDFFVTGDPCRFIVLPLILVAILALLVGLQQAQHVSGSTKKLYRIWCIVVILSLVGSLFTGWPMRKANQKRRVSEAQESEIRIESGEKSAKAILLSLATLENKLDALQKEVGIFVTTTATEAQASGSKSVTSAIVEQERGQAR